MGPLSFDLEAAPETGQPVVEWEECHCLLCGSRRWSILVEAPDPSPSTGGLWFCVVQCHDCGLCFTNPRPTARTIGQFYPEEYQPHRRRARVPRKGWWNRLRFWKKRSRMEGQILPWRGQGRLLDFGCGSGEFLHWMHREGWQVAGLDTSETAIQRVRSELGMRAVVGSLPHPELPDGSFDVVTMWHSLEHVHRPMEVLRAAHRVLGPGGLLVVEVPNIDSLPFYWFGRSWFGLELPRHLTHFAPQTLELMLQRAGFVPGTMRMLRQSDWLRYSARRAHAVTGRRWQRWLTGKTMSNLAGWYCHLTRRGDCIRVIAVKDEYPPESHAFQVEADFSSVPVPPRRGRFRNR